MLPWSAVPFAISGRSGYIIRTMAYKGAKVGKGTRVRMSMALNAKSTWILGGTLLITAASTLAGCASMPLTDSKSAEKTGASQDQDDSMTPSWPANVWHSLRNAMGAVYDAGISFNPLMISRK